MGILVLRNRQLSPVGSNIRLYLDGMIYIYLGFLFSFVYYGTAKVQSIHLSWPNALVTSLFIPFAFSDLPINVWLKLAAGIHCTVIVAVGAGTLINYLARRAEDLENAA